MGFEKLSEWIRSLEWTSGGRDSFYLPTHVASNTSAWSVYRSGTIQSHGPSAAAGAGSAWAGRCPWGRRRLRVSRRRPCNVVQSLRARSIGAKCPPHWATPIDLRSVARSPLSLFSPPLFSSSFLLVLSSTTHRRRGVALSSVTLRSTMARPRGAENAGPENAWPWNRRIVYEIRMRCVYIICNIRMRIAQVNTVVRQKRYNRLCC